MIDEFYLIQNPALGAHTITEFVREYSKRSVEKMGPPLPFVFSVLPIAFNSECINLFSRRKFAAGSFVHSVAENRGAFSDLQYRIENMSELSFESIGLAFAVKALSYDSEYCRLVFLRTLTTGDIQKYRLEDEYKRIISIGKRLGAWYATIGIENISRLMHFNF